MRILLFESGFNGGSVRSCANLAIGFEASGHDVGVVSYFTETSPVDLSRLSPSLRFHTLDIQGKRPEIGNRFGILFIPTLFFYKYFFFSLKLIRKIRPDVIHLNNSIGPHLPAFLAARLLNLPVTCHVRTSQKMTGWQIFFLKYINHIIVLTGFAEQYFNSIGISLNKISVIYNPIDLKKFDDRSKKPLGLDLKGNKVYVVQVGALKPEKRPDLALESFAIAHRKCPNLRLILAGEGPMRHQLELQIDELGLRQSAMLIGRCDVIESLLCHSHISLLVSQVLYEGLPNVVMEGMAARMPVVTIKAPAMIELVEDNKTGIVVENDHPQTIAAALTRLYDSQELRERLGHYGRKKIESNAFDHSVQIRRISEIFEKVLGKRKFQKNDLI